MILLRFPITGLTGIPSSDRQREQSSGLYRVQGREAGVDRRRGDRRRQPEDDPGHDLDHHSAIRHSGHFRRGNDSQGGSPAVVPAQDRALQERQRAELPSLVQGEI